jgi:hypothetical protein
LWRFATSGQKPPPGQRLVPTRRLDQTLQTSPQIQPTIAQLTSDAVKQTAVIIATLSTTARHRARLLPKMARKTLANSPARYYSYADETGITALFPLKIQQFRDRN